MKNRMENRRGMSHIEVILSFVMFVGFLLALFVTFPINYREGMKVGLDSLENGLMNYTETDVSYVSFALNSTLVEPCFTIDLGIAKKVVVKNETNDRVGASSNPGGNVRVNNSGGRFYTAYYSYDFVEVNPAPPCKPLAMDDYSVGLNREYRLISYKNILALNTSYYSDYPNTKTKLFVPGGENFKIALKQYSGTELVSMKINTPPRAAVYSKDIPIRVIYENGTMDYLWFSLQMW